MAESFVWVCAFFPHPFRHWEIIQVSGGESRQPGSGRACDSLLHSATPIEAVVPVGKRENKSADVTVSCERGTK